MRRTQNPVAPARRRLRGRHGAPAEPLVAGPATPEPRERVAARTRDEALYTCGCGCAFTAEVSASVACPACGGAQNW